MKRDSLSDMQAQAVAFAANFDAEPLALEAAIQYGLEEIDDMGDEMLPSVFCADLEEDRRRARNFSQKVILHALRILILLDNLDEVKPIDADD